MLKVKKISEVLAKKVFTDTGDFFGEVEEVNIVENKIDGWRIRVAGEFGGFLGGARGVIIPHQFVRAIGTIMIIARSSLPNSESTEEVAQTEEELM
jgi:sporulation protein YlmC with PRC-barrel domain